MLSLELIEEARAFLTGRIRRTPVEPSPGLSERMGVPVWLKLESLQVTGSFKVRGAFFRMSKLTEEEKRTGIATCSAGNHGKGVAYVARELHIPARIYVPSSVDESKYRGMVAFGAEVLRSRFTGYDDTEAWAKEEAAKAGIVFLSAFDDWDIMAGNGGTLAAEVLEDVPEARVFVLPVGGAGMAGGFAFYASEKLPEALLICCQHEGSPALKLSLERGRAVTRLPAFETAAGGLEGGIGEKGFQTLRSRIGRVALLSEVEILQAVRWMLDTHQYLIEPSAAVTVAACRTGKIGKIELPAVVVLSGRNISFPALQRILAGGRSTG
ncbi:MAG TPA: pyridoxal-phosphate dependent enzyme [Thermoanaerobaculia bacterium]|nr:pyridoxal-phosphate dependent enzyme [Thermoanaerobaculia bacterium]